MGRPWRAAVWFGCVAGVALLVSPAHGTVLPCEPEIATCERGFALVANGDVVPPNARLILDAAPDCPEGLGADIMAPGLFLEDGTPIESTWVARGWCATCSWGLFVREGPMLPADSVIVVRDAWRASCEYDSCGHSPDAMSCELATTTPCCDAFTDQTDAIEWFRFRTAAEIDRAPPSAPGPVHFACYTGDHGNSSEYYVPSPEPPDAPADVAEIHLYVQQGRSVQEGRPASLGPPTLEIVWTRARAGSAYGPFHGDLGPDEWLPIESWIQDVAGSQNPWLKTDATTFRFVARAVDLAGNESEDGEATTLVVPDDCVPWPGDPGASGSTADAGAAMAGERDASAAPGDAGARSARSDAAPGAAAPAASGGGCRALGMPPTRTIWGDRLLAMVLVGGLLRARRRFALPRRAR